MGFNTWIHTWHSQRLGVNFMSSHAGKLKGTYFWGLVTEGYSWVYRRQLGLTQRFTESKQGLLRSLLR